ncbi:hypothetical protein OPKNFCMD_4956 [Methylobacterium crusticola]|uniref:Translation initiation factor IF-2 n=1 Tax=Methylobacterium crusticola TaxID=1697972 RepID=A0ABQ4R4Y2_9HYPH|nr:hypothetical protein [Methylobacterium crusticola]GJD52194.1 hypothetical protein OPKNFCMD_4956 [Methylobacterium crusticola]
MRIPGKWLVLGAVSAGLVATAGITALTPSHGTAPAGRAPALESPGALLPPGPAAAEAPPCTQAAWSQGGGACTSAATAPVRVIRSDVPYQAGVENPVRHPVPAEAAARPAKPVQTAEAARPVPTLNLAAEEPRLDPAPATGRGDAAPKPRKARPRAVAQARSCGGYPCGPRGRIDRHAQPDLPPFLAELATAFGVRVYR